MTRFRGILRAGVWVAIGAAAGALVLLVILNQSVSTGWRMYVLARILKTAWAATIAIFAAASASALLDWIATAEGPSGGRRVTFVILKIAVAAAAAVGAFAYYLPDWDPWTAAFAGIVVVLWGAAALCAISLG
jgi:hypothetical protein